MFLNRIHGLPLRKSDRRNGGTIIGLHSLDSSCFDRFIDCSLGSVHPVRELLNREQFWFLNFHLNRFSGSGTCPRIERKPLLDGPGEVFRSSFDVGASLWRYSNVAFSSQERPTRDGTVSEALPLRSRAWPSFSELRELSGKLGLCLVGRPGRSPSPAPLRTRRADFPHRAPTEAIRQRYQVQTVGCTTRGDGNWNHPLSFSRFHVYLCRWLCFRRVLTQCRVT